MIPASAKPFAIYVDGEASIYADKVFAAYSKLFNLKIYKLMPSDVGILKLCCSAVPSPKSASLIAKI